MFIEQSLCPVGVFVNRKFVKASNTLIVIHFAEDLFLLNYADHLKQTTGSDLTILNLMSNEAKDIDLVTQRLFEYTELQHKAIVYNGNKLTQNVLSAYNFMLISYNTWNLLSEVSNEELQKMPSTLILSK